MMTGMRSWMLRSVAFGSVVMSAKLSSLPNGRPARGGHRPQERSNRAACAPARGLPFVEAARRNQRAAVAVRSGKLLRERFSAQVGELAPQPPVRERGLAVSHDEHLGRGRDVVARREFRAPHRARTEGRSPRGLHGAHSGRTCRRRLQCPRHDHPVAARHRPVQVHHDAGGAAPLSRARRPSIASSAAPRASTCGPTWRRSSASWSSFAACASATTSSATCAACAS